MTRSFDKRSFIFYVHAGFHPYQTSTRMGGVSECEGAMKLLWFHILSDACGSPRYVIISIAVEDSQGISQRLKGRDT